MLYTSSVSAKLSNGNVLSFFKYQITRLPLLVSHFIILILTIFCFYFYFQAARKFSINYETDSFEMDGKPFQYVSGSFHYFRAVPDVWEDRLKVMRAAGLNALDTYVEWSLHNPQENVYDFEGIADVERFLTLAQKQGFYVILRPGPYICAERDNVSAAFCDT